MQSNDFFRLPACLLLRLHFAASQIEYGSSVSLLLGDNKCAPATTRLVDNVAGGTEIGPMPGKMRVQFLLVLLHCVFSRRKRYNVPVPGACAQLPHKYLKCLCVPITRNYRFLWEVAAVIPSKWSGK